MSDDDFEDLNPPVDETDDGPQPVIIIRDDDEPRDRGGEPAIPPLEPGL